MAEVLYLLNDNLIKVTSLTDASDGSAVTGATVQVTLVDAEGTEVGGQSWPATLSGDGSGNYEAVLEDGITGVSAGDVLTAQITVDAGADAIARWDLPVWARTRVS